MAQRVQFGNGNILLERPVPLSPVIIFNLGRLDFQLCATGKSGILSQIVRFRFQSLYSRLWIYLGSGSMGTLNYRLFYNMGVFSLLGRDFKCGVRNCLGVFLILNIGRGATDYRC